MLICIGGRTSWPQEGQHENSNLLKVSHCCPIILILNYLAVRGSCSQLYIFPYPESSKRWRELPFLLESKFFFSPFNMGQKKHLSFIQVYEAAGGQASAAVGIPAVFARAPLPLSPHCHLATSSLHLSPLAATAPPLPSPHHLVLALTSALASTPVGCSPAPSWSMEHVFALAPAQAGATPAH